MIFAANTLIKTSLKTRGEYSLLSLRSYASALLTQKRTSIVATTHHEQWLLPPKHNQKQPRRQLRISALSCRMPEVQLQRSSNARPATFRTRGFKYSRSHLNIDEQKIASEQQKTNNDPDAVLSTSDIFRSAWIFTKSTASWSALGAASSAPMLAAASFLSAPFSYTSSVLIIAGLAGLMGLMGALRGVGKILIYLAIDKQVIKSLVGPIAKLIEDTTGAASGIGSIAAVRSADRAVGNALERWNSAVNSSLEKIHNDIAKRNWITRSILRMLLHRVEPILRMTDLLSELALQSSSSSSSSSASSTLYSLVMKRVNDTLRSIIEAQMYKVSLIAVVAYIVVFGLVLVSCLLSST